MHVELRASLGVILGAFSIILQEHVTLLWVENGKVLQYFSQNCKCFENGIFWIQGSNDFTSN